MSLLQWIEVGGIIAYRGMSDTEAWQYGIPVRSWIAIYRSFSDANKKNCYRKDAFVSQFLSLKVVAVMPFPANRKKLLQ